MKNLKDYIKECLDVDNFDYKFDIWFSTDTEHKKPMLDLMTKLSLRKIVQKEDIDTFLEKYNTFKIKKFVDFFDEDVKKDEAISIDYIYLFTNIIKTFITNFNLRNKVAYEYQALNNGDPNVEVAEAPMQNEKEEN